MKKLLPAALGILISVMCFSQAQVVLEISPDRDATINDLNPDDNLGTSTTFNCGQSSEGGDHTFRSLMIFDPSAIPAGATIDSAILFLYGETHFTADQSTESVIRRITSPWSEGGVTWNNQPSTTGTGKVTLTEATETDEDYQVDIKTIVKHFCDNPGENYGIMMMLTNDEGGAVVPSAELQFGSSDNPTPERRPKLRIVYTEAFTVTPTITNVDPIDQTHGSISLAASGGSSPYTYSWSNSHTTSSINNLNMGEYTVTVTDNSGSEVIRTYSVLSRATWENVNGATESDDGTLTKTAASQWGNAGAASSDYLSSGTDGFMEYTKQHQDINFMVGLTAGNPDDHFTGIEYAVYFASPNLISVYESGSLIGSFGSVSPGDKISIHREGSNIRYKKNGTTFRTVATDNSKVLNVDVSMFQVNLPLYAIYTNFEEPFTITPTITDVIPSSQAFGSISLAVSGGASPYSYLWSNGQTSSSIAALNVGDYSVTITDSDGGKAFRTYSVSSRATWENVNGATEASDGTLTKTASSQWGNAGAASQEILPANTDGYMVYTKQTQDINFMVGLTEGNPDDHFTGIEYAVYFASPNLISVYESGTLIGSFGSVVAGDEISIHREGSNILYQKNGVPFRTVATDPAKELNVDVTMFQINLPLYAVKTNFEVQVFSSYFFASLKRELDASYYKAYYGTLKFKYRERYKSGNLNFKIYDDLHVLKLDATGHTQTKQVGMNWFSWNMNSFSGFSYSNFYVLEVIDENGRSQFLRFKMLGSENEGTFQVINTRITNVLSQPEQ